MPFADKKTWRGSALGGSWGTHGDRQVDYLVENINLKCRGVSALSGWGRYFRDVSMFVVLKSHSSDGDQLRVRREKREDRINQVLGN